VRSQIILPLTKRLQIFGVVASDGLCLTGFLLENNSANTFNLMLKSLIYQMDKIDKTWRSKYLIGIDNFIAHHGS
jgi:hypothetical protein